MAKGYITPFQKLRTGVQIQDQITENLGLVFSDISAREILSGRYIALVNFRISSIQRVDHGLARPVKGWIVIGIDEHATVRDLDPSGVLNPRDVRLLLEANRPCSVSLWVF